MSGEAEWEEPLAARERVSDDFFSFFHEGLGSMVGRVGLPGASSLGAGSGPPFLTSRIA